VGKPVDCEVRAVDGEGATLPAGEVGELHLRGAHVFSGYVGAETSERFADGGWLRTGDLGSVDAEGLVRVHGRLSSSFKSGAVLVNPDATTAALRRDLRVLDAASIGIAAPAMGTMLVSAVVLQPQSTATAADLLASLRNHVPAHQLPRHLLIVDELPLGPSGKSSSDRLREMFRGRLTPARHDGRTAWAMVQEIAADAFGASPDGLSACDTPSSVDGWDSFGHLAFVSGLETTLGRTLALDEIQTLRSLADAVRLVEDNAP
jgi:acyl-CoA synthetase (AMP-forming)/AMP-acid ligase II/acyl carrier protein